MANLLKNFCIFKISIEIFVKKRAFTLNLWHQVLKNCGVMKFWQTYPLVSRVRANG
jgi:hypothetical protein